MPEDADVYHAEGVLRLFGLTRKMRPTSLVAPCRRRAERARRRPRSRSFARFVVSRTAGAVLHRCPAALGALTLGDVPMLVLLRHGESRWNAEGLFTGWVDVGLAERGAEEAGYGGRLLADAEIGVDAVHTSVLKRAIQTANIALEQVDLRWLPVRRSRRLDERHYGALQGKSKAETRDRFGAEQFMLWRRSYASPVRFQDCIVEPGGVIVITHAA